jgi:hypothetical protein
MSSIPDSFHDQNWAVAAMRNPINARRQTGVQA